MDQQQTTKKKKKRRKNNHHSHRIIRCSAELSVNGWHIHVLKFYRLKKQMAEPETNKQESMRVNRQKQTQNNVPHGLAEVWGDNKKQHQTCPQPCQLHMAWGMKSLCVGLFTLLRCTVKINPLYFKAPPDIFSHKHSVHPWYLPPWHLLDGGFHGICGGWRVPDSSSSATMRLAFIFMAFFLSALNFCAGLLHP